MSFELFLTYQNMVNVWTQTDKSRSTLVEQFLQLSASCIMRIISLKTFQIIISDPRVDAL